MSEPDQDGSATTIAIAELASPCSACCALCEPAEVLPDGSVTLRRIVNRWGLRDVLPPIAISFWIAIGFKNLTPSERIPARLIVIHEDSRQAVSISEPDVVSDTSELNYLVEADGFIIHQLGHRRLSELHGDREIGRFPFEVALDPAVNVPDSMEPGAL